MMEILKHIRWLSLDIALGGVIFLNFIGDQLNVEVPIAVSSALAVCIWLIYSVDHQRDVRLKSHQKGARRIFHKKNKKVIIRMALLVGLLGLVLLFFLPLALVQWGLLVALICFGYLMLSARLSSLLVKEVIVALLYGGGVFLFPFIQVDQLEGIHGLLSIQLALLAFVNIVLISTFELEEDRFNGFTSLSLSMGKRATSQLLGGLLIISGLSVLIIACYYPYFMHLELIYLFASLQLTIILLRPAWFVSAERYRVYSDAIFFYPLIFLW
jgi:1,4-dihydroxy-2-naphthoate octaprenyltransferase|tara:strand:- start:141 stop:950 length:810 start_codon:yes stop_codon:yes gene_type:complete